MFYTRHKSLWIPHVKPTGLLCWVNVSPVFYTQGKALVSGLLHPGIESRGQGLGRTAATPGPSPPLERDSIACVFQHFKIFNGQRGGL